MELEYLILLLVAASALAQVTSTTEAYNLPPDETKQQCIKEWNLEAKNISGSLVNWDELKNKTLNYHEKCLLTCILQKTKHITPLGEPIIATLRSLLPDGVKVDFKKCAVPKNTEKCDVGYIFIQCFEKTLADAFRKDGS